MRESIEFQADWRFSRTAGPGFEAREYDDRDWDVVRIPHDWAIRGPFDPANDSETAIFIAFTGELQKAHNPGRTGGLPHVGKGFYRKRVHLPDLAPDRRVRIEFDGVMSQARVYCNGRFVGERPYGYSSFAFDLTPWAQAGENVIAVSAENLPAGSRWYPGAGIYRPARLTVLDAVHVAHWGVFITTRGDTVRVRTTVDNQRAGPAALTLRTAIRDAEGHDVAAGEVAAEWQGPREFDQTFAIPGARRWQPGAPHLYTAVSTVIEGGDPRDAVETRFGIRDLAFDGTRGFLINGTPMKFNGVCLHHDLGPLGAAIHRPALRRQLRLLQEMGCNAIRTSHNPPAPDLLDLCDELGFLVIDEAFDEWRAPKCPNGYHRLFDAWGEADLRDMIRRDRNHPSVILWSIGNEIDEQYLPEGPAMARRLCDICHDEDPTRPTTAGLNNVDDSMTGGLFDAVDVKGFNYKPYLYAPYHHAFPDRAIYSSESASTISSRGEYDPPAIEEVRKNEALQVTSYDLASSPGGTVPDHEFKAQDECPYVMGEFVWTGFDYLGEPTPYREEWPSRSAYYGILDLCGLPKDRFYLYQSRWTDKPVLHLMPHWTWPGKEGRPIAVQCYTSWPQAELFVNGVSQGIRKKNRKKLFGRYRLRWTDVVYQPGELAVAALDADGREVVREVVRTAGEPARLELLADRDRLRADGEDMAFVTFRVTDRAGTVCPDARDRIAFEVEGPAEIAAVDNGDPTDLDPFPQPSRRAFHGLGVVYLRATRGPGDRVVLRASGKPGAAQIELRVV